VLLGRRLGAQVGECTADGGTAGESTQQNQREERELGQRLHVTAW
jgi:hypothetical protein